MIYWIVRVIKLFKQFILDLNLYGFLLRIVTAMISYLSLSVNFLVKTSSQKRAIIGFRVEASEMKFLYQVLGISLRTHEVNKCPPLHPNTSGYPDRVIPKIFLILVLLHNCCKLLLLVLNFWSSWETLYCKTKLSVFCLVYNDWTKLKFMFFNCNVKSKLPSKPFVWTWSVLLTYYVCFLNIVPLLLSFLFRGFILCDSDQKT